MPTMQDFRRQQDAKKPRQSAKASTQQAAQKTAKQTTEKSGTQPAVKAATHSARNTKASSPGAVGVKSRPTASGKGQSVKSSQKGKLATSSVKTRGEARNKENNTIEEQLEFNVNAPKRRPGRDPLANSKAKETPMMEMNADSETQKPTAEDVAYFEAEAEAQAEKDTPKVEIHFKGSELLRARFPKPFDVAEAVATDWGRDGKFENLPISHPLAQWATQQGLLKAKEIEKKVMESPALEKAAMTALTMGMKAQGLIAQVRGRLKR